MGCRKGHQRIVRISPRLISLLNINHVLMFVCLLSSFDEFSQISFGDHFGVDFCTQHEWDPKALMQNHEFLNPES